MKSKNKKNQKNIKKEEPKKGKENDKKNNNKKKDKVNEEEKNIEKKEEEIKTNFKKPSPWIFLYGKDLQGFHTAFILMIIFPISVFYIIRNILSRYNFTRNQQDVYGVIGVLISVWIILVTYIIYYFRNDFYTVFCQKKEKEKDKND